MFFLNGLRVLMYHRVSKLETNGLTVSLQNLEQQILWLKKNGFYFCHPSDLLKSELPQSHCVFITFDDAYKENFQTALPLLEQLKIPAMTFVPTSYINGVNEWDQQQIPLASATDLQQSKERFPHHYYGLHCHHHRSYRQLTEKELAEDLALSGQTLKDLGVPFNYFLAYPYGHYPKENQDKVFNIMEQNSIQLAFRIGQRINRYPFKRKFLIERIDMRGDVSEQSLQRKIRFGKIL